MPEEIRMLVKYKPADQAVNMNNTFAMSDCEMRKIKKYEKYNES